MISCSRITGGLVNHSLAVCKSYAPRPRITGATSIFFEGDLWEKAIVLKAVKTGGIWSRIIRDVYYDP